MNGLFVALCTKNKRYQYSVSYSLHLRTCGTSSNTASAVLWSADKSINVINVCSADNKSFVIAALYDSDTNLERKAYIEIKNWPHV